MKQGKSRQSNMLDRWEVQPGRVVNIVRGDIVKQRTEGVVNAANSNLLHGAGVAGAISKAAGKSLNEECERWIRRNGNVMLGAVAVTGAGNIADATHVFHTVGPRIGDRGVSATDRDLLSRCLRTSLSAAVGEGVRSISVPAISTGIFRFPVDEAASILVEAAVSFFEGARDDCLKEVRFVLFDEESFEVFKLALGVAFATPMVHQRLESMSMATGSVMDWQTAASRKARKLHAAVPAASVPDQCDDRSSPLQPEACSSSVAETQGAVPERDRWEVYPDHWVTVVKGDICGQRTAAVVNAANADLGNGGGVAGAIFKAGGSALADECARWVQQHGRLSVGSVAVTGAGNIADATHVFHTVGPRIGDWGVSATDRDLLSRCLRTSLSAAVGEGVRSISVPAISTGIFRFPVDEAASILVEAAVSFFEGARDDCLKEVRFVVLGSAFEVFKHVVNSRRQEGGAGALVRVPSLLNTSAASSIGGSSNGEYGARSKGVDRRNGREGGGDTSVKVCDRNLASFSAAGVLMYRFVRGELKVLIGVESRAQEGLVWNILGGQRDKGETPVKTAAREFWEESGKLESLYSFEAKIGHASATPLWLGFGKYVLFLVPCPSALENLDERYNSMRRREFCMEMSYLLWARWQDVVDAGNSGQGLFSVRSWRHVVTYPLSSFLERILSNKVVIDEVCKATFSELLPGLIAKVKSEATKLDREGSDSGAPTMTAAQRLRLAMPRAVPDTSPITALAPNTRAYQQMLKWVPAERRAAVRSIRQVCVATRDAEHRKMEAELRKDKSVLQVMDAMFHGTPEVWRATNIAFKGFDLSIRTNGRAYGDGVYSASSMETPLSYCKANGSILQLRGVLTASDYNSGGDPCVHVYRKTAQVLVTGIIDFDADTTANQAEADAEADARRRKELYDRQKRELGEKEKKYLSELNDAYRRSRRYYQEVVDQVAKNLDTANSKGNEAEIRALWKKFELERMQFRSSPVAAIYSAKAALVDTIRANDVVVVTAATGSGKSTQLPQYLLDNVFPEDETRRIAVLQPKRVNVVSLSQRVSQERHRPLGTEVGYSLGLGDTCVSAATRIEFMTHGLFMARAQNPGRLRRQYCAVVLDEAHHRSVDVDMCFALLRKSLQYTGDCDHEAGASAEQFKVVVASATLTADQLTEFQDFLTPPPLKGSRMHVGGHAFPVLTVYRPEAEPDWNEANSLETSKALAAYATEVAIQLVQSNGADGNVLIFMPGESVINHCMQGMSTWALFGGDRSQGADAGPDGVDADAEATGGDGDAQDNGGGSVSEADVSGASVGVQSKDQTAKQNAQAKSSQAWNRGSQPAGTTIHIDVEDEEGKKSVVAVGVYAFHGKITEQERQKMLQHSGQDVIVIFCTNVAETGLTLPNIRYVVDTGLERRVVWNAKTGMQEMRTVQITQSSMNQRTGRAGRVASGICVRLYSEETASALRDAPGPEIESGMLLKAVLGLHLISESDGANGSLHGSLDLLTDIPDEAKANAEEALELLGALEKDRNDAYCVSDMGRTMAQIGLPFRISRFLLACDHYGCLGSGVAISAMISIPNPLKLLPLRKSIGEYVGRKLVHPASDHITLLNIFNGYSAARDKHGFCVLHGFDTDLLESAVRCRNHLEVTMCRLRYTCADDEQREAGLLHRNILKCLCFAFADQMMSSIVPGSPEQKFVRVVSEERAKAYSAAATAIASGAGLLSVNPPQGGAKGGDWQFVSGVSVTQPAASPGEADSSAADSDESESESDTVSRLKQVSQVDALKLSSSSAFWFDGDSSSDVPQQFAVFGSILLTDTQKGPTVELVSYVYDEDVVTAASKLGMDDSFRSQVENSRIVQRQFPLSKQLKKLLVANSAANLQKHFTRFVQVSATLSPTGDSILVSAPAYAMPMLERQLESLTSQCDWEVHETAEIGLSGLTDKQVGQVIKVYGGGNNSGDDKKAVVDCLNQMVIEYLGGQPSMFHPVAPKDIAVVSGGKGSGKAAVSVKLFGACKQCMSAVLALLQSGVVSLLKIDEAVPRAVTLKRASGTHAIENLTKISMRSVPVWDSADKRGSAMLLLAHTAVWTARCCVYGGFIRDFIVRGERANDVDVGYRDGPVGRDRLKTAVLAQVGKLGLSYNVRDKGMAYAIKVSGSGMEAFDIDLVDLTKVQQVASSPGVDSDVGNLVLELTDDSSGGLPLKLKINKPHLATLAVSLEHCRAKKFLFYYEGGGNGDAIRLSKYLSRGWTCLNTLPEPLRQQAIGEGHGALLQPLSKYSSKFY